MAESVTSTENGVKSEKLGFKGLTFGKNVAPKKLQPGVLRDEHVAETETETDFITGMAGTEIESKEGSKPKPQEIVIPLQPNRLFKGLKGDKKELSRESKPKTKPETKKESENVAKNDLEANAINELLQDAQKDNEDWENRDSEAPKNLTIPSMSNRNIDSEDSESGSEKEETDYEKVPVSSFGMAMLRGMGFKEDEGIGLGDRKKTVTPVQAVARPKGLGLGADRSAHATKNQVTGKTRQKDDKEELVLEKGAYCQITEGKNEDMYGQILSLDEETARVFVKLTLGESVNITQFKIRLVSKAEYTKYSKYINKGRSDKYKEEEQKKYENTEKREEKNERNSDNYEKERDNEKEKKRKNKYDDHESSSKKSKHRKEKLWLRPQLRVRIIDKKFSKGKYFKEKVRILDVLDQEICECRTDDGKLLELKQNQLETVIPRERPFVYIISGKYAGLLGEILEKDKDRSIARVQLLRDRDKVLELSYDDICEYTGDIDADLDY